MKFKEFVMQMFSGSIDVTYSGTDRCTSYAISSKRVCGFIGWIVIMGLAIYGTISGKTLPECTDTILFCVAGLLGVDSVTSIWKK